MLQLLACNNVQLHWCGWLNGKKRRHWKGTSRLARLLIKPSQTDYHAEMYWDVCFQYWAVFLLTFASIAYCYSLSGLVPILYSSQIKGTSLDDIVLHAIITGIECSGMCFRDTLQLSSVLNVTMKQSSVSCILLDFFLVNTWKTHCQYLQGEWVWLSVICAYHLMALSRPWSPILSRALSGPDVLEWTDWRPWKLWCTRNQFHAIKRCRLTKIFKYFFVVSVTVNGKYRSMQRVSTSYDISFVKRHNLTVMLLYCTWTKRR